MPLAIIHNNCPFLSYWVGLLFTEFTNASLYLRASPEAFSEGLHHTPGNWRRKPLSQHGKQRKIKTWFPVPGSLGNTKRLVDFGNQISKVAKKENVEVGGRTRFQLKHVIQQKLAHSNRRLHE